MSDYNTGYKVKVTDDELLRLVDAGISNSVGDFLNSSELARERLRSTYEYAGVPEAHLTPNGVSTNQTHPVSYTHLTLPTKRIV